MNSLINLDVSAVPVAAFALPESFTGFDKSISAFLQKADEILKTADFSKYHITGPLVTGGWEPDLED